MLKENVLLAIRMDGSNTRVNGNQNNNFPNSGNQQNFTSNFNAHQPPNYMSYAFGGSYDENQYSQYAPGDYNISPPVSAPRSQPNHEQIGNKFPPKTFTDTGGGRAPDTQSAIRPTSSRDWRAGSSFPSEQKIGDNRMRSFQQEKKDVYHPAFEIIGNSEKSEPVIPAQRPKTSYYSCPVCGELATRVLDNANRDASCKNNHRWSMI